MYGEENKSRGLDLEEIEYEDFSEEMDEEDLEEIEYDDFEEETEYDEIEIEEFEEEEGNDGELQDKESLYADGEKISSMVNGVFITLTVLGVVAVLVVLGMWFLKEKNAENNGVSQAESIVHQSVIDANAGIAEHVVAEDVRLAEERKAAEEAARLEAEAAAKAEEEAKKDLGMVFSPVQETVTAKDVTNLRDIPSQGEDSTVMLTLQNGQTATRIGVSDKGWSKLEYNGETYYAISNYLTTDLTVKPQEVVSEDDGIKTVFTACNEQVTPKIEVNLRTLPSVTNPDATVVATIKAGEVVTRTGINTDVGWSRVEYNGQTLYCVSSYVYVVQ
ncbi:MAG: hypothetical protein IJZ42_04415 [Lachnospiraceae bacterium]|nr:hypothetical protein [Lachnospiraceae bacterium]